MTKKIFALLCCSTVVFATLIFATQSFVVSAEPYPVKEILEPYIKNNEIAGIVAMVADRNNVLQMELLGFRNIEKQEPMTGDTLFWIASQTKPFTAVAAMILVDRGKLSLTEPVTTYLPELAEMRVIAEKDDHHTLLVPLDPPLTLAHLLSHTGGLRSDSPNHRRHGLETLPLRHTITAALLTPLDHQPGKNYQYSNFGIDLAAAIIERIANEPFERLLQNHVFNPLNMKDTTFWPSEEQQNRMALVYQLDEETNKLVSRNLGLRYPLHDRTQRFAEAGGGLFSTPNDLVKFYQMLLRGGEFNGKRIIKEESVREIVIKRTGSLPQDYGLGMKTANGVFGHAGAAGTESVVNPHVDRVFLYFMQEFKLPKAGEAKLKFVRMAQDAR
ncbi:MAG: beta-lactamase family protein [Planctomycetaceae bacterium]|jgi:CubicO group peptidase (beta-lactamase class C family)|nr:beta-lactamase family protein [Planctomycetaceae bacterium]